MQIFWRSFISTPLNYKYSLASFLFSFQKKNKKKQTDTMRNGTLQIVCFSLDHAKHAFFPLLGIVWRIFPCFGVMWDHHWRLQNHVLVRTLVFSAFFIIFWSPGWLSKIPFLDAQSFTKDTFKAYQIFHGPTSLTRHT